MKIKLTIPTQNTHSSETSTTTTPKKLVDRWAVTRLDSKANSISPEILQSLFQCSPIKPISFAAVVKQGYSSKITSE